MPIFKLMNLKKVFDCFFHLKFYSAFNFIEIFLSIIVLLLINLEFYLFIKRFIITQDPYSLYKMTKFLQTLDQSITFAF